ncbi:MAG TPA: hypothetical protein VE053_06830 [Allosphingosinicella sp.]|nr:hypothetical protein [Allosphingosinicella sp.]
MTDPRRRIGGLRFVPIDAPQLVICASGDIRLFIPEETRHFLAPARQAERRDV